MSVVAAYHPRMVERDGSTGKLAEADFMPDCDAASHRQWAAYKRSSWNYPDVDEDDVLREVVRHNQPYGWNPANPRLEGGKLHGMVAKRLGIDDGLRLYTAFRSPLDDRGADGFFDYRGRIVTIDLTLDGSKLENGYKADVVVGPDLDFAAYQIAERFAERCAAPRLDVGGVMMPMRKPPARPAAA